MHCIANFRRQQGMSQRQLAERLGVSRSTVGAWESTKMKAEPDHRTLIRIADLFDVSVDEILGRDTLDTHRLPLIGEVNAGFNGAEAQETFTGEYLDIPSSWLRGLPPSEFFILKASGNSMWPDIRDGDRLLVRRTTAVNNGRIAIVIFGDGAATVKTINVSADGSFVDLEPRNPEYPVKRITGEDLSRLYVQGEVIMVIRQLV